METTVNPRPGDSGPSLVGRLLDGRYRLDSVIARGGMGSVYLAIDTRLDRIVAVKVMHRFFADDPEFVARFTREAKAAVKVSGPEVVAVHDQGTDPETGLPYLVMEHIRGQNVRELIKVTGRLSPERALTIIEPVLRALAGAHAFGVVHRDVKPENVLLGDNGAVKVTDFGLAKALTASDVTTAGTYMGTFAYYAPEQSQGVYDARSDVYAAGILLWELLVGAPPHAGDNDINLALKHVQEDVPAPSTVVPGIPPALDALVVRATRRDPQQRPADAGEFLRELKTAMSSGPVPVTTALPIENQTLVVPPSAPVLPVPVPTRSPKPKKRRTGLIASLVVLLLAFVALGTGYYLGSYRYTHAPSVLRMRLSDATTFLKKDHLRVRQATPEFSDVYDANTVMKQSPNPNDRVLKNGTVTLVLSKGPDLRVVPSYKGKTVAQETAALRPVGLSVAPDTLTIFSTSVPAGIVINTDPRPGVRVKPGTAIRLTVSKGRPPVNVPSLKGKSATSAEATLQGLGLTYTVDREFSDSYAKDAVISSSPDSGTVTYGSTIALVVSKGPDVVTVPHLKDMSVEDATLLLHEDGLVAKVDSPLGGDTVVGQSPKAGTVVHRGVTVTIYVF